jgi:hypothetical protein
VSATRRSHGRGLSINFFGVARSFWKSCFTEAVDKDPSPPFVPSFNSNAHASEEKPYLAKPSGLFG